MQKGQKHWKQWGVLLLVLLVVPVLSLYGFAAETIVSNEPVCYEHGDVNSDGIVDSRDAIYVLYHTLPGDTKYPVSQDCDFNGDENIDAADAIYVLYGTFDIFADEYPLNGTVHAYYEPQWIWNTDGTVRATLKCGCGETTTVDATVSEETEDATCVVMGVHTVTAVVEYDGHEFTTHKTEFTPVSGHKMVGTQSCTESSVCSVCGYALKAKGHQWSYTGGEEATCAAEGHSDYSCTVCGETKQIAIPKLEHDYVYTGDVARNDCAYYRQYQCSGCDDGYTSETFYNHSYTAKLTKEATCASVGEVTYTCVCGSSYTAELPTNDSHIWDDGVVADNVTTYTCTCGETKTAICVADTSATVTKDDLQATNELQLQNASVALDDTTLENLADEELQITVDKVDVNSLNVDLGELAGQIVDGVVYDFSMYCGEDQVTEFEGEVTISIPYVLQDGDDVDCIDIWYIDDEGNVNCYQGTYSNGEVTFTTKHFSYYTVTRLTPAQRCEKYGHAMVSSHRDATCTTDGYDVESCQRCGAKEKNETLSALGHDYTESIVAATCTHDGSKTTTCSVCKNSVTYNLPATGHEWSEDAGQSVEASCSEAGKTVYVCAHCDESYTVEEAQLEHTMETTSQEADCTNGGYTSTICSVCGYGDTEQTPALGHEYLAEDAVWAWAENYSSATVTLVCSKNVHTVVLNAVVTKTSAANSTCNVVETYAAAASYNGTTYTSEKSIIRDDVKSHQTGELQNSATQHYYKCSVCGETVNAESHSWTEKVTKEPTCAQSGTMESTCSVCGYIKETTLNATGDHNYVNGTCSVCGRVENSCDHVRLYTTEIDLSGFGICEGGEMWIQSCECGEKSYVNYDLNCYLEYVDHTETKNEDGSFTDVYTYRCEYCGLTEELTEAGVYDAATCTVTYYCTSKYTVDGATVAEDAYTGTGSAHSMNFTGETIVLQPDGMCGVVLQVYSCGCGLRSNTYMEEGACDFWYSDELSTDDVDVHVCDTCGAIVKYYDRAYGFDKETCQEYEYYTCTYEFKGEALCTFTNTWLYTFHDYIVNSYEMYGESCEDGVSVEMVCRNCGATSAGYSENHLYGLQETIDLSGQGYCVVELYQYVCPCGEYKGYGYSYGENDGCAWAVLDDNTEACTKCGLQRNITMVSTPNKDENCRIWNTETITFYDPNGNVLGTLYDIWWYSSHHYETTYTLLKGSETCEDGVRVTQTCKDCGYSYDYTTYYHATFEKACYDLSEYGLCGGKMYIYGCACDYRNGWEHNFGDCEWESYWDEQLDAWVDACTKCGATFHVTYDDEELGNCKYKENVTVSFTKDGETLLEVSYFNTYTSHRDVYELTLVEGGTSCEDGYTVSYKCLDCGISDDYSEVHYSHSTWTVDRVLYNEGQFCGDVELIVTSCACGQEKYGRINWTGSNGSCDFWSGEEYWSEPLGVWVHTCAECGAGYYNIGSSTRVEDTCQFYQVYTYHYLDQDGHEILSYERSWYYTSHDYVNSFNLLGESCDNGYTVIYECTRCGDSQVDEEVYYGHEEYTLEKTMLSAEGQLCGDLYLKTVGCACGEYVDTYTSWYNGYCDFWSGEGYWDDELGHWVYVCETCGAERVYTGYTEKGATECEYIEHDTVAILRDGQELFSYEISYISYSHDYVYTLELLGEICDDGYNVTGVCQSCGETETWTSYGCGEYCVSREVLYNGEGICAPIIQKVYSCACGYYYSERIDYSCYWNNESYDEELDCWVYVCDCGLEWWYQYSQTQKDENCRYRNIYDYTFRLNGEVIATGREIDQYTSHTRIYTFDMWGETCDEGYDLYGTCVGCGATSTSYTYGCSDWLTGYDVVYDSEDICGPIVQRTYGCPCGDWGYTSFYNSCSWSYCGWDEELQASVYQCNNCGLQRNTVWTNSKDENCLYTELYTYTYYLNGEIVATCQDEENWYEHNYVYTFKMWGETCDEGYDLYGTCADCGKTYTGSSEGCRNWVTGYEVVYDGEGICGPIIQTVCSCPCGSSYYERIIKSCYWDNESYDEELDRWVDVCECGLEWWYQYSQTEKDENCRYRSIYDYTFRLNGEVIATGRETNQYTSHTNVVTFAMEDESLGCDGGYTVYYNCTYCGEDGGSNNYSGHHTFLTKAEIPGEDSCNVVIYTYSCPCGKENYISINYDCSMSYDSWSETDANGVTHYFYKYTCENCPFSYVSEEWQGPGETVCEVVYHYVYTYYYDGQVYGVSESLGYGTSHTYGNPTMTLCEGAVTCDDGVLVTYNCQYCDYWYRYIAYYHRTGTMGDPIDLRDYGAVCETYLAKYGCACGEYVNYQLGGDESCDMDWNWTDNFIDGSLYGSQYTTEGWQGTYSNSDILTCAVTDPQCAFKIRMSDYWLQEGCEAVRYQTWQVGYDETAGTYAAEFTVATGDRHAYHSYTESSYTTTLEDGTEVRVVENICSDCDSSWIEKDYYVNGSYAGYENIATNTLDNGEDQKYHEIYLYNYLYNDCLYTTLSREERVYADGSSYWYQYEYEYDFDNGCIRTETYTNSYGEVNVYTSTCHSWSGRYVLIKDCTCSQFGEYGYIYTCVNCGEVDEDYYVYYPNEHSWFYDDERDCYVCWYCDLENANGATGSIVIEDLTEAYGEDTNYVVGYWNKNDIEVLYYVSVVLDDADNEIVLTDVSFTELTADVDGITAITFNQAEAIAAAEAALAEAGYSGSYAIRFTFVPVNGEDTLDYAITFDSLTA